MDFKVFVMKVIFFVVKNKIDYKIFYIENVFLEDFVYLVRDKYVIVSGIIKEELGGIESNLVGGVWIRMVMCRDFDGRVV